MNALLHQHSVPRSARLAVALSVSPRQRVKIPDQHAPGNATPGQFLDRSYSNEAGTIEYKLYIPSNFTGSRMPLIVMLHGCKQNPDDFATGSGMNDLADRHGFLVAYPAQQSRANGQHCWNWFDEKDQVRGKGEPSLIAGLTLQIAAQYPLDEQRCFVAGMSSGAAMAVILGATYPDIYRAVGAHSGLAHGAARDVGSAFAAMWGSTTLFGMPMVVSQRSQLWSTATRAVPTIVFHGDEDSTVRAHNGMEIVNQAISLAFEAHGVLKRTVQNIRASNGRTYTATSYGTVKTGSIIEYRLLHGAGHAWSGGSAKGSYTDPHGPDASAQMVDFFLAQPCAKKTRSPRVVRPAGPSAGWTISDKHDRTNSLDRPGANL